MSGHEGDNADNGNMLVWYIYDKNGETCRGKLYTDGIPPGLDGSCGFYAFLRCIYHKYLGPPEDLCRYQEESSSDKVEKNWFQQWHWLVALCKVSAEEVRSEGKALEQNNGEAKVFSNKMNFTIDVLNADDDNCFLSYTQYAHDLQQQQKPMTCGLAWLLAKRFDLTIDIYKVGNGKVMLEEMQQPSKYAHHGLLFNEEHVYPVLCVEFFENSPGGNNFPNACGESTAESANGQRQIDNGDLNDKKLQYFVMFGVLASGFWAVVWPIWTPSRGPGDSALQFVSGGLVFSISVMILKKWDSMFYRYRHLRKRYVCKLEDAEELANEKHNRMKELQRRNDAALNGSQYNFEELNAEEQQRVHDEMHHIIYDIPASPHNNDQPLQLNSDVDSQVDDDAQNNDNHEPFATASHIIDRTMKRCFPNRERSIKDERRMRDIEKLYMDHYHITMLSRIADRCKEGQDEKIKEARDLKRRIKCTYFAAVLWLQVVAVSVHASSIGASSSLGGQISGLLVLLAPIVDILLLEKEV